jgi:hypothetical protein
MDADQLQKWLTDNVSSDLESVPGIGRLNKEIIEAGQ